MGTRFLIFFIHAPFLNREIIIQPTYIGRGNLLDPSSDGMLRSIAFSDASTCKYSFDMHPSAIYAQTYRSNVATVATVTVGVTFLVVVLIFFLYDALVQYRNRQITQIAERSNAVVNSLFPAAVMDRLMIDAERTANHKNTNVLAKEGELLVSERDNGGHIADFFPETTGTFQSRLVV